MDGFYIDIIRKKNPSQVQDDYLGGELLLNANIILESAQRRFYFCEGKGIDYGFTITTNGTLISKSIISEMKTIGMTGIRSVWQVLNISMTACGPLLKMKRPTQELWKILSQYPV